MRRRLHEANRPPLMREHRLIEKMLSFFEGETRRITELKKVDPLFVDTAVDFIRTYADRTHHGKEEDNLMMYPGVRTPFLEE